MAGADYENPGMDYADRISGHHTGGVYSVVSRMMIYLAAFAASFVMVALKSTQQLSVVRGRYAWVPPVSYGMAACEVFIISQVATNSGNIWMLIAAIGTGGWMGCFLSMTIDRRMRG